MTTSQSRNVNMVSFNPTCIDPSDLGGYINFNQSPVLDKGKIRLQQSQAPAISPSRALSTDMTDDSQPLQPSHNYSQYKQQLGLPTAANPQMVIPGYYSGIQDSQQSFDGMSGPSNFEMNSPSEFNIDAFLDNDAFDQSYPMKQEEPIRMYPGMNQQVFQVEKMMRQRQLQMEAEQDKHEAAHRASHQPLDAIQEHAISKVLDGYRRSSHVSSEALSPTNSSVMPHILKAKKAEEEMDEDERLLNSEEGKKLSSKERRQLRNKVSARAFRSRRKEYIGQLEEEVQLRTNEANEFKRMNQALMQENARFKQLAEKFLSHPAFRPFMDELSRDPAFAETLASVSNSPSSQPQQMPKDIDPFIASQQFIPPSNNETHVGMTLIPDMPLDLSALNLGNQHAIPFSRASDMGSFMPHVYAVMEVPEGPSEHIDFASLSGKDTEDILTHFSEDEKVTMPEIESPVKNEAVVQECAVAPKAEEPENLIDENDETMTLYAPSKSTTQPEMSQPAEAHENLFGDIAPEKAFARFELSVSSEQDNQVLSDQFERMCARLEARCSRIEALMSGL